jgi:hypothetical protein
LAHAKGSRNRNNGKHFSGRRMNLLTGKGELAKAGAFGQWHSLSKNRSPYNGLAIHKGVLNRYENLLLYSSFQRVTNRSF